MMMLRLLMQEASASYTAGLWAQDVPLSHVRDLFSASGCFPREHVADFNARKASVVLAIGIFS